MSKWWIKYKQKILLGAPRMRALCIFLTNLCPGGAIQGSSTRYCWETPSLPHCCVLGEPEMRHKDFLESTWQWRKGRTHFFTLNPIKISCSRPYPQMTVPSKSFYGDLSFYNHGYPMARNIRQPQSSTKDEHHWKNDWLQARRKEITQDGILF